MAYIPGFNEAVIAAANVYLATGGLTPTFSDVTITGGTTTTNNPVLDMTQTWNNVATTFTGLKLNVTDTASASGSLLMDLQVGGVSKANLRKDGALYLANSLSASGDVLSGGFIRAMLNTSQITIGGTSDIVLARDAANVLALRNGTASQAFNVYNTYTDASNYERGYSRWNAGVFEFGMETAGTGTTKHTRINRASGANLYLGDWFNNSSGHFVAATNNTYDIGTSTTVGAPRYINAGSGFFVAGAGGYFWSGVGSLTMPVSGGLQINDASATNTVRMTAGASNLLTLNGGLKTTGATFALQTATTLTDNAAAQVATMTNGPAAGNPTKWIAINDNGTTRYIPAW